MQPLRPERAPGPGAVQRRPSPGGSPIHFPREPPQIGEGRLPVFVFPTALTFYADDQRTHKQVLTLYNPYEFPLRFKLLCTAPKKYVVVDSEGTIRPHCCVDIVVRHADIAPSQQGIRDKFRLNIYEHGQKRLIGQKDIMALLLASAGREEDESAVGEERMVSALRRQETDTSGGRSQHVRSRPSHPGFVIIAIATCCILVLTLPTHLLDKGSSLPDYLHLTLNQKLVAAYILGLVTMVILRS
ncbi:Motile sperm domain-containing protein 1 [Branchiostoma belcheri]|nr:Motile sperm domain-containing protein 1 [Branchiostoma belcheri]